MYIEEVSSGVRPINGVATSIAAFVGYTARGLDDRATRVFSFGDFERTFGGLAADSELSYAVQHFFLNGGTDAYVVRVPKGDSAPAVVALEDGTGGGAKKALTLTAAGRGGWGNLVVVDVDHAVPAGDPKAFNLSVTDLATGAVERFANVTLDPAQANNVVAVVNDLSRGSQLVTVGAGDATAGRPVETGLVGGDITMSEFKSDKDYSLKVSADLPVGTVANVVVTFLATGEPVPSSIPGVCALLGRKINLALGAVSPGFRVRCVPSASGRGVRVLNDVEPVRLPAAVDAVVTVAAGTPNDALGMLGLAAPGSTNVGRYRLGHGRDVAASTAPVAGANGVQLPVTGELIGSESASTGIYALDRVDLFNILCIPDATRAAAGNPAALATGLDPNAVYAAALALCQRRRAFLIVDPPPDLGRVEAAVDWISGGLTVDGTNAAAYFPRLRMPDPLADFQPRIFAPCGAVAGLYARTDAALGVWKAPAGTEATLAGVRAPTVKVTDAENGTINPLGLNAIRSLPVYGTVAWGARTLQGGDVEASQWKYVPVRRLALMIEESVFRGTQWAVFEPNDTGLWSQLQLSLTSFMHGLFRQGAFQGTNPREAYLVKCDRETTTQADVDRGLVNVVVGFAPLKPAEFVVIRIQQLAGQSQA